VPKPVFFFALTRHVTLLTIACALAMVASCPARTHAETFSQARDTRLSPSDEEQARDATRTFQEILDRLNATPTPSETEDDEEELVPENALARFEAYLRDNRTEWYVVLTQLALAAALGLVLAMVYRFSYTGKKKKYSRSMMQSQVLLAIGGAFIWVLVANYLVRAFGLAGMVGLIRYRTPVRDPKDNVMVFLSMGIGMACGLAQITAALVTTGFVALVLMGMHEFGFGRKKKTPQSKPSSEEHDTED
jgi:hypothetical protein